MIKIKRCYKCKRVLLLEDFYKNKAKKDGHADECKNCLKKRVIKWNKSNKEKVRQRLKKYYRQNKRKYQCYGQKITVDDYVDIFNKQNGCCAICGISQLELNKVLQIDHDHITGKFRGLLCHHCNIMLGGARDNINTLKNGIKYLKP